MVLAGWPQRLWFIIVTKGTRIQLNCFNAKRLLLPAEMCERLTLSPRWRKGTRPGGLGLWRAPSWCSFLAPDLAKFIRQNPWDAGRCLNLKTDFQYVSCLFLKSMAHVRIIVAPFSLGYIGTHGVAMRCRCRPRWSWSSLARPEDPSRPDGDADKHG